ncbi:predicted protein [Plenodomus lingam JN3]|uniref:Predicted protein n=1 Tax=Leptosphaeria maculans (strain JN3 / isolate v23.1.3 / race Av1-4-5-6-7-8) TaxID=985895 RepID=E4ZLX2_LEPMJ|nr:predicted protein [Plenodomus lingam JN3]CBX92802.1 predicted protein [Plenodomus lingam JN3]
MGTCCSCDTSPQERISGPWPAAKEWNGMGAHGRLCRLTDSWPGLYLPGERDSRFSWVWGGACPSPTAISAARAVLGSVWICGEGGLAGAVVESLRFLGV